MKNAAKLFANTPPSDLKIICSIRMLSCQAQLIHYLLRLGITHCITCKVAEQVVRLPPENMDTIAARFATVQCTPGIGCKPRIRIHTVRASRSFQLSFVAQSIIVFLNE